jgi:hypothetical protein
MNTPALTPIDHPSAWYARDLAPHPEQWCVTIPAPVLAEMQGVAARMDRSSVEAVTTQPVDRSQLPQTAAFIEGMEKEVMLGRGFVVLKGLPAQWDDGFLRACYWIMINLLGRPVSQNSYGELLCEVKDLGKKLGEARVRGYMTNEDLKFHTDRAAMVGLLCMQRAKSGGVSRISSAVTVFNHLIKERPDLVPVVAHGLNYMSVEEGGEIEVRRMPIYDLHEGVLSCRYSRNTLATAILQGAPYTDAEKESLDVLDRITDDPELCLDMTLDRGDIQLVNNFTTLHARTDFQDWPEPERRRCMARAWIATNIKRPVAAHFSDYYGVPQTLKREAAA